MSKNFQNTLISFALMLFVWSWLFGSWAFALAFLVLLGIHEMGHYVVAQYLGMKVSMPIFTPIGAMINLREAPKNAYEEALMAYGGPFLGTIGALGALVLGTATGMPILLVAAKAAFWLNLFNLIPLSPLDGGRISMAIDRRLWVVGVPMLAALFWFTGLDVLSLIVGVLIVRWAYQDVQYRSALAVQDPGYFAIGAGKRVQVIAAYLALAGFLLFMLLGA